MTFLSSGVKALIESSVVLRWVRRVAGASVVCRVLALVIRAVSGALSSAERQFASRVPLRDDATEQAGIDTMTNSRILRVIRRESARLERAARASLVLGSVSSAVGPFRALEIGQRVRLIGWMLLVAVVTRALAAQALEASAPGAPAVVGWTVALLVAVGMMRGSAVIASAWIHRRDAREGRPREVLHP